MNKYTDGFLIPVPKANLEAYRAMAESAGQIWKEHGALDYKECVLDDGESEHGLPFPKGINSKDDEAVVFSWIVYESREHRDAVNARVMKDPRIDAMCKDGQMPFDSKRMMYGGFKVIVDAFAEAGAAR